MATESATIGVVWTPPQQDAADTLRERATARDSGGPERLAEAKADGTRLVLKRDRLGVAPLYYGQAEDESLCFASEVKALMPITGSIHELPPGHTFDGVKLESYFTLEEKEPIQDSPENIARELRRRLERAVEKRTQAEEFGSWLSGGLDSSTLAALAAPRVKNLFTFAAGLDGAPDLEYAKEVARFIGSDHREVIVTVEDMLAAR